MQEPCQNNVKLLPGELDDEELEEVVGGRPDGAFQEWRVKIVNNFLHQLYSLERSRTAKQPGVITESVSPPKK
jgi:hypothetical protein